jgi:hypothetical protein
MCDGKAVSSGERSSIRAVFSLLLSFGQAKESKNFILDIAYYLKACAHLLLLFFFVLIQKRTKIPIVYRDKAKMLPPSR